MVLFSNAIEIGAHKEHIIDLLHSKVFTVSMLDIEVGSYHARDHYFVNVSSKVRTNILKVSGIASGILQHAHLEVIEEKVHSIRPIEVFHSYVINTIMSSSPDNKYLFFQHVIKDPLFDEIIYAIVEIKSIIKDTKNRHVYNVSDLNPDFVQNVAPKEAASA
jgi:hypothetical protein